MHLANDPSRWWEKEHDDRCNITIIGAEPLAVGGDCTCDARLPAEPRGTDMSTPRISDFKLPFEWDVVDQHTGEHQGRAQDYRSATVSEVVAAFIAEGGEIVSAVTFGSTFEVAHQVEQPGRYLVFPIPESPEVPT